MIDVVKRTPKIYRDESRDFQVLARLYTSLFNLTKMYIDDLKIWEPNIDNKLITLRSRTVNFINRHQWDLNDLEAITSCFKYLMRRKGTEYALEACINILMKSRGLDTGVNVDSVVIDKSGCINIWVVNDKILSGIMEDLVRYLIPTGLIYRIYNYDLEVLNAAKGVITDIYYRQDYIVKDLGGSEDASIVPGFSDMRYYFNKSMLLNPKPTSTTVPPTSDNFGDYGSFITNTFVYTDSEGVESMNNRFRSAFLLYVSGLTLYVVPEKDYDGTIIAPTLSYDPATNTFSIGPSVAHDPRGVIYDPDDTSEGHGTLVWNERD